MSNNSVTTQTNSNRDNRNEWRVKDILLRVFILLLATLFILTTLPVAAAGETKPVKQSGAFNIGPTTGQVVGVVAGGIAAIVVITVLVYYGFHHGNSIRGCATATSGGLEMVNEGDQLPYTLTGDVAGINAGQRLRISGKKIKGDATYRKFVIQKVKKDYGPCVANSSTP